MDKILFLVEGQKSEPDLITSLKKSFENKKIIDAKIISYNTNIYKLYRKEKDDFGSLDDVDILANFLKEKGYKRNDFSEIYLFFDLDSHDPEYSADVIVELLEYFYEETENGKLYISYPMFEALCDISESDFLSLRTISSKNYKNNKNLKNLLKFNETTRNKYIKCVKEDIEILDTISIVDWFSIFKNHIVKKSYIVNNDLEIKRVKETELFEKQLIELKKDSHVYVVSAIPSFVLDYIGVEQYKKLI
ncbi:hypothetical protein QIW31_07670 [Francisellaceae bacterium CB299]